MTLVISTDTARLALQGSDVGTIHRLFNAVRRSIAIAQNRRFLQGMPDYVLKDIGINRLDIDSVVVSIIDGKSDPTRRSRGRF
jgi:uncharacterized protein YjiS (DUF1127 family)